MLLASLKKPLPPAEIKDVCDKMKEAM